MMWVPLSGPQSVGPTKCARAHVNSTRVPFGANLNSTRVPRGASIHEGAPILGAFRYSIDYYIQLVPLKKCYCWELSLINCWSAYNWQLHCQPVYCANSCIHFSYKIFMNKEYDWKVYNALSQIFMKTLHNLTCWAWVAHDAQQVWWVSLLLSVCIPLATSFTDVMLPSLRTHDQPRRDRKWLADGRMVLTTL